MIGTTIGNYVVKEKIGEGGMGVVYVAEHPRIGRKVAIKVLLPEFSQNPEVVSRFFTEARASSAIKNEHIIDIIDFGELPDRSSYIIMEWLEGDSLTQTLERDGRLPLERALHIARGIGRALAAAHHHNIVHRDLKPDNIFLVTRGDDREFAKVLDFGIAKLLGNEGAGVPSLASKTRTGAIIGTPMYMSPEQCRGVQVDERSDIYSFAVIVYQMLVGVVPFAAEGLGELLLKHMTEPPRPLRDLVPTVPEAVERAVLMALEKDPAKRFRRVENFISALGGHPTAALEPRRATEPMSASTSTRAVQVGATDTIGAAVGETVAGTARAPRRTSRLLLALPAVGILVAGVVVLRDRPRESTGPVVAAVHVAAPAVVAPKPTVPATVLLDVGASPPEAKLTLDGKERPNPYVAEVPYGAEVRVVFTADGYVPYDKIVKLERRIIIHETLTPAAKIKEVGGHTIAAKPATPRADKLPRTSSTHPDVKSDAPPVVPDKGPTIYTGTKVKLDTNDPYK